MNKYFVEFLGTMFLMFVIFATGNYLAIGAALASDLPTMLITGDISFLYDSNALWNNYIPKNFKIILLNNSGGGIFRILPGHQETETFNTYFETSHQLNASHLAKMYGLALLFWWECCLQHLGSSSYGAKAFLGQLWLNVS